MLNDPLKAWMTLPPNKAAVPTLVAVRSKVAVIGTEIGASIAVMSTDVLLEIVVTPPSTVAVTWSVSPHLTDHRQDGSIGDWSRERR